MDNEFIVGEKVITAKEVKAESGEMIRCAEEVYITRIRPDLIQVQWNKDKRELVALTPPDTIFKYTESNKEIADNRRQLLDVLAMEKTAIEINNFLNLVKEYWEKNKENVKAALEFIGKTVKNRLEDFRGQFDKLYNGLKGIIGIEYTDTLSQYIPDLAAGKVAKINMNMIKKAMINFEQINPNPDETYHIGFDDHCLVLGSGKHEENKNHVWISLSMCKWIADNYQKNLDKIVLAYDDNHIPSSPIYDVILYKLSNLVGGLYPHDFVEKTVPTIAEYTDDQKKIILKMSKLADNYRIANMDLPLAFMDREDYKIAMEGDAQKCCEIADKYDIKNKKLKTKQVVKEKEQRPTELMPAKGAQPEFAEMDRLNADPNSTSGHFF